VLRLLGTATGRVLNPQSQCSAQADAGLTAGRGVHEVLLGEHVRDAAPVGLSARGRHGADAAAHPRRPSAGIRRLRKRAVSVSSFGASPLPRSCLCAAFDPAARVALLSVVCREGDCERRGDDRFSKDGALRRPPRSRRCSDSCPLNQFGTGWITSRVRPTRKRAIIAVLGTSCRCRTPLGSQSPFAAAVRSGDAPLLRAAPQTRECRRMLLWRGTDVSMRIFASHRDATSLMYRIAD
jgi:hypothetical protein